MLIRLVIAASILMLVGGVPPKTGAGITPIPFDKINPRANEFRRLDTDGDEQISFTEFILGDHHYIERQSAAFHKLDEDGDGVVSRGEYDAYYKRIDDERRRNDMERERFFEGLVGFHQDPVIPLFRIGGQGPNYRDSPRRRHGDFINDSPRQRSFLHLFEEIWIEYVMSAHPFLPAFYHRRTTL
ncbi:EF hand [Ostertagia ostertagi]